MITSARPIGVEIFFLDLPLIQIAGRGGFGANIARRGNVIGRHRIAEQGQDIGIFYGKSIRKSITCAFLQISKTGVSDVGRFDIPGITFTCWRLDRFPTIIPFKHISDN